MKVKVAIMALIAMIVGLLFVHCEVDPGSVDVYYDAKALSNNELRKIYETLIIKNQGKDPDDIPLIFKEIKEELYKVMQKRGVNPKFDGESLYLVS